MNISVAQSAVHDSHASVVFGEAASCRKELADLRKRFDSMERQYKAAQQKLDDFRDENKRLRASSDSLDRDSSTYRLAAERFQAENKKLESRAEKAEKYAQKLESKLALGAKNLGLVDRNQQLQSRIDSLNEEIRGLQSALDEKDSVIQEQTQHLDLMTEALEIHAEKEGLKGDFKSALMYDVAKYRGQVQELEIRLEEKDDTIRECNSRIENLQVVMDELNFIRDTNRGELLSLEAERETVRKEKADFESALKQSEQSLQVCRRDFAAKVQECATVREQLRNAEEKCRDEKKRFQMRIDELRSQLESVSSSADRELGERKKRDSIIDAVGADLQNTQARLKQTEEQLRESRDKCCELEDLVGNLTTQLQNKDGEHQDVFDDLMNERLKSENLQTEVSRLRDELSRVRGLFDSEKQQRADIEKTSHSTKMSLEDQVKAFQKDREDLRNALEDSIRRAQSALTSAKNAQDETDKERAKALEALHQRDALEKTLSQRMTQYQKRIKDLEDEISILKQRIDYEDKTVGMSPARKAAYSSKIPPPAAAPGVVAPLSDRKEDVTSKRFVDVQRQELQEIIGQNAMRRQALARRLAEDNSSQYGVSTSIPKAASASASASPQSHPDLPVSTTSRGPERRPHEDESVMSLEQLAQMDFE
eukprot:ANDGO_00795.mRNA.1 hypothetical protein